MLSPYNHVSCLYGSFVAGPRTSVDAIFISNPTEATCEPRTSLIKKVDKTCTHTSPLRQHNAGHPRCRILLFFWLIPLGPIYLIKHRFYIGCITSSHKLGTNTESALPCGWVGFLPGNWTCVASHSAGVSKSGVKTRPKHWDSKQTWFINK